MSASKSKEKAKGISASSFFDLKAELSKQEEEFARHKASGKSTAIVGGVPRPDKKPTVWARQNKGLKGRAARDVELEAISKPTLESARAALERKAKIYEKLSKGKTGGLSDQQYEALLVDFDNKAADRHESDSDDVDESLTVPKGPEDDDDPIVEYEDEFGRVRKARRSEVPRELLRPAEPEVDEDEDLIIHDPTNHFPIYEPTAERTAEIAQAFSESANPLNVHYDAAKEVREKGAGFYQFSSDEETRRKQMEELQAAREETEKERQKAGAVDVSPGEIAGMREGDTLTSGTTGTMSKAMEKRKREIEERRKLLDAKRRKLAKGPEEATTAPASQSSTLSSHASAEKAPQSHAVDPFAALESQSRLQLSKDDGKGKPLSEADAFLAQLEGDILAGKTSR